MDNSRKKEKYVTLAEMKSFKVIENLQPKLVCENPDTASTLKEKETVSNIVKTHKLRKSPEEVPDNVRNEPTLHYGKTSEDATTSPFGTLSEWKSWLKDLLAPLSILGTYVLFPKSILIWVTVIIAKPVILWFHNLCPEELKHKITNLIPNKIRQSEFRRELSEGADQGLPFVLFWLYIFCIPFACVWICVHWVKGFLPDKEIEDDNNDSITFKNFKISELSYSENNFFYSKIFGVVVIAVFALGIPAQISYSLYQNLGIEKQLLSKKRVVFEPVLVPLYKEPVRFRRYIANATNNELRANTRETRVIEGYKSNHYEPYLFDSIKDPKWALYFVFFYLMSLGCALTAIFIRAWFFFPLNFFTTDHLIEVTEFGIRKKGKNDWFFNLITFNRFAIGGGPDSLKWSQVKSLRRLEEGFTRLHPLPDNAFSKESLTYKFLNRIAAFIDGISNKVNSANEIVFSATEKGTDGGRNIKIDMNNLNEDQRAQLFYSVRKWAPHVIVNDDVEKELLGSTVLKDVRYTQLWYDLLTKDPSKNKKGILSPDDTLNKGEFTVEKRINSGGQATTYIAQKADGTRCVLKEFILASSATSGALIESAREFEAEVSYLTQLDNPGIVKIENFFTEHGRVYAALEFIEGETLREKVAQKGALCEAEVIKIGRQVCKILEYLHALEPAIVHRDVTPENLIIEPSGTIKLIDFSLASNEGEKSTDTCGKQAYTPPEQFREEACPQSDIYALGATLHFLLTGSNPKPIMVSAPKNKVDTISTELNEIIKQATQLELKDRYDSAHWMDLDLAKIEEKK